MLQHYPDPKITTQPAETVGSLCTGVGGLDRATLLPPSWHAEIEPGPAALLAHLHPGVPNLGDFRVTDWSAVEPVTELVMGVPCQPTSETGPGTGDADPRWLWPSALFALQALRPRRVFFENTEGLVTYQGGRLWRRILGDFRREGYVTRWLILGACAVGAPHHRHRVFLMAWRIEHPWAEARLSVVGCPGQFVPFDGPMKVNYMPTVRASDAAKGPVSPERTARTGRRNGLELVSWLRAMHVHTDEPAHWRKGFHPALLSIMDGWNGGNPPEPLERGPRGGWRLAAPFAEWMMGFGPGRLTDRLDRKAAIKAAGNAVVPLQAYRARQILLSSFTHAC